MVLHCLRLRRSCRYTGTVAYTGFAKDNRAGCRALRFQYPRRFGVLRALLLCFARFVFRFGFTDAQHRRQTLFFQYGSEFLAISSSDSFVISTTLGVPIIMYCVPISFSISAEVSPVNARQIQINVLARPVTMGCRQQR